MTLVELVVALAIMSVLGVLSYRALTSASASQLRLSAQVSRWEALSRALGRIETEASAMVAAPLDIANQRRSVRLQYSEEQGDSELSFLRLDEDRGVRRVGFRRRGERLEWVLWDGRESAPLQVEPLLDGVRTMRWAFYDRGQRVERWPDDPAHRIRVPDGLVLILDVDGVGSVQRLFAVH
jgi:general secretion pathway protein J